MTRYAAIERWFRQRPRALGLLRFSCRVLPLVSYVVYPMLLLYLLLRQRQELLRAILVPATAFFACTAVRDIWNVPRPYETQWIHPLVHKDTKGHSFPSRHMAAASVIAVTYLRYCAPVGALLLVLAAGIGICRVLGGLHYPRDVVAGFLFGGAIGWVGCFLIP